LGIAVRLRSDATRRWGSATLALLLHLLLLLGLLRSLTAPVKAPHATAREMILRLLPMLKSAPAQDAAPPAVASPQLRSRVIPLVQPPLGTAPAPSLSGLGQNLFGCAPENLNTLSREQRSHCTNGLVRPDDSVMVEPPSHVKDPARRAAEMAAKRAPAKIPCTYMTNAPAPYGGVVPVPMTSLDCLREGIFGDGLKPFNRLGH
jgi:hypothetical protein